MEKELQELVALREKVVGKHRNGVAMSDFLYRLKHSEYELKDVLKASEQLHEEEANNDGGNDQHQATERPRQASA